MGRRGRERWDGGELRVAGSVMGRKGRGMEGKEKEGNGRIG